MKTPLLSWLFLLRICYVSLTFHTFVVSTQCPGDQQSLLLKLKDSLTFDPATSRKLVKWNNASDYCSWEGVSCKQGCVSNLDLSNEAITGGLDNSSPLFGLKSIENLNLAYNNFNYTQIPSEFKQLTGLTNLNLSNAGFAEQVPIEISHLTRLVTLDLSTLVIQLNLEKPNLKVLIRNFSELVKLYLDGVNISAQGTEWCQAISSSLPKLRVLSLSACSLSGPIDSSLLKLQSLSVIRLDYNDFSIQVPEFFSKFPNLTSLHLSDSGLYGTFPEKIFQVPTLQTIDLSSNPQLQGSLPEFPKNASLRSLVLRRANFSGFLPNSIGNLKMLSNIDISWCNFIGSIPRSTEHLHQLVNFDLQGNEFNGSVPSFSMAKNLTSIYLYNNLLDGTIPSSLFSLPMLQHLDLSNNLLDGTIPSSLFSLPMLQHLYLSYNHFSGQLPEFGNFSSLQVLDLSSNSLEGPIPMSIFNLRQLHFLSLSSNNFSGSFLLNDIQQLKNLQELYLSYNSLLINHYSSNSSYSCPQLRTLKLAAGKLRTFPDFLRNQSILEVLDLSLNQIHEIPNWIWRLSTLGELNLSCNSLVNLPGPFLNLSFSVLDLHSNQLQGPIPMLPPYAGYLDYSRNNFSSSIPAEIGDFLVSTVFFSLASNHIHGIIPESVCKATSLEVLDLSNNSLSGMIPQCLTARNGPLAVLDLRRNKLSGTLPDNFPENCSLQTLDLNGNVIGGQFPKSLTNCTMLEVLNLGNNQITDVFPCSLQNISSLRVLVLRFNKFYDSIECLKTKRDWPKLQIIDLARNNFTGEIPGSFLKTWQAMMADKDGAVSKINHLQFQVLVNGQVYYQDTVTVTTKGQEMELARILTVFTSIDISCNNFNGSIPEEVGKLTSLHGLNLSSNALTGAIPSSLGNLRQLESLDLSDNKLSGTIPSQLSKLNFLSFLNLSSNQLVGKIPTGTQIQSFSADSFAGNKGLYGPPLDDGSPRLPPTLEGKHSNSAHRIDWDLISVEVGFIVGFGVAVGSLVLCKRWSKWYYKTMYKILVKIFPQLEDRIGPHRRHVHINQRFRR
ncbi:receptor-like protein 7 [Malus domestica]|uniref:receptor-like protein 7 n=1 Tax=Malus domestica TaxID=3750 RepID=UPI000498D31F|nr:receptor-like protein 6 [Malus domestica]